MKNTKQNKIKESGFMLISVLIILSLSLIVAVGMVTAKNTEARVQATVNRQSDNYYAVEETLHRTLGWMQENSKYLITPFQAANFNNNFDMSTPSNGDNEGSNFGVPTLVKMKGTNNSVMLSNNAFFGTSAFPATTHIDTGASFDAVAQFSNADLGDANSRIVLIWARETSGDFEPIFRVDVVTGNNPDRGVHSFSYIYSNLVASSGSAAFFTTTGEITLNTGNNKCYSHNWTFSTPGSWSRGADRSNCVMASDSSISTSAQINGDALAKADVNLNGSRGEVSGTTCANDVTCHSLSLASVDDWNTTCGASHQGDLIIGSNTTLSVASSAAADKCWRDVFIASNAALTLDTTSFPYHFRTLTFQNNSNSKLEFADLDEADTVTLYLENIDGNSFNGNQWYNRNNAPHQVELYITGPTTTTLNGTAVFYVNLVAPASMINLNGNFNFYGGIKAAAINALGNARLNADEKLSASGAANDIQFSLRKASQRYRLF